MNEQPDTQQPSPAQPPSASLSGSTQVPIKKKTPLIIATLVIAVLLIGGGTLAYVAGWLPFGKQSPEQVISRMLDRIQDIKLAEHTISAGFKSKPREAGAVAWDVAVPEFGEQKQAIKRDNERLEDLRTLQQVLENYFKENKNYPVSLNDLPEQKFYLGKFRIDPATSQQYGYRQEEAGNNYVLHVTLETKIAIDKYLEKYRDDHEYDTTIRDGKTIEAVKQTKRVYLSVSFSDVSPYPIYLDFSDYYQYLPVEVDAVINLTVQHDLEQAEAADVALKGDSKVSLGGTTFEGAAELRKIADDFFARIEQAPSFGFFDLAALKQKWIHIPLNELTSFFGYADKQTVEEKSSSLIKQYKLLLDLVAEKEMIVAEAELPMEEVNGDKSYHYQVKLNRAKLPEFYRDLTTKMEEQFGDDAIIEFKTNTLSYLESQEFEAFYNALDKNVVLDLWIDTKNYWPRRLTYTMQLIPPAEIEKQKDIQYELSLAMTLDKINEQIIIEKPTETISLDEALVLLTGESLAQVKLGRQKNQVENIRQALGTYYSRAGVYPSFLEELTKKISEIPNNPPADDESYRKYTLKSLEEKDAQILRAIPVEVYTRQPYGYTAKNDLYKLTYEVKLGEPSENTISYYSYQFNVRVFVEGTNTATPDELSVEGANPDREIPDIPPPVVSGPLGEAQAEDNAARIKSNLGQLRTIAQIYYDANASSYAKFDTCAATPTANSCGSTELASIVQALSTDLATIFGSKALTVNAAANTFCISHPLLGGEQTCVDSTGLFKTSVTASCGATATSCPSK